MRKKRLEPSAVKPPPGPRGLPILGSLMSFRNAPHLAAQRMAQQYGDLFALRLGSVLTVVISHPQLLRQAFAQVELADRWVGEIMDILTHHGKDMAMAPYGAHWRQLQRISNQELFVSRRLQRIRESHIEQMVDRLVEDVGRLSDAGQPMEPLQVLPRANAMLMFRVIFGRSDWDTAEFEEKREALLRFVLWTFRTASAANPADYIPWFKLLPNHTISETRRQVVVRDGILEYLLAKVSARPDCDLDNPTSLAEVMLARQRDGEITEETVRLLISDLLLAGIDTSAQAVAWLLLLLANRPKIQSNVHEELDHVLGSDKTPILEDRGQLPYLNAVIMESMRYKTVGPFGLPHRAARACEVGGVAIPEGAQVLGNIYSIHHDPRFWDAPEEFVPDRFMPLSDGSPSPAMTGGAFIPFGVGRRGCPGSRLGEIVVWLQVSRLLHSFRFEVTKPGEGRLPEDEVFGLTLGPRPFALSAIRRSPH